MLKGVGEAVEFNHVSMRYPGTESNAVTDANVHIEAGEFFSFLVRPVVEKQRCCALFRDFWTPPKVKCVSAEKTCAVLGRINARPR